MKCSNSLFNTAQMKCVAAFFQIKGQSILIQMYSDFFGGVDCTQTSAVFGTQFSASFFFGFPESKVHLILSFKPWGQWQLAISMLIYDLPKRRVLPDEAPCAIVGNELCVRFCWTKTRHGQQKPQKWVGYGKDIHINWQWVIAMPKPFHRISSIFNMFIMFVPTNPDRPGVIFK